METPAFLRREPINIKRLDDLVHSFSCRSVDVATTEQPDNPATEENDMAEGATGKRRGPKAAAKAAPKATGKKKAAAANGSTRLKYDPNEMDIDKMSGGRLLDVFNDLVPLAQKNDIEKVEGAQVKLHTSGWISKEHGLKSVRNLLEALKEKGARIPGYTF